MPRFSIPSSLGRLSWSEASGALGDLGTLVPLLVGMAQIGVIDFVPALFFGGVFNVLTGFIWGVPMCVQPMKTIAAIALADGLSRVQVSLAGLLMAAIVGILGISRGIVIVNNIVPLAVVRGIQIGLGLSLMKTGLDMVVKDDLGWDWGSAKWAESTMLASGCFGAIVISQRCWPRFPIAMLLFMVGLAIAGARVATTGAPFNAYPALPWTWALRDATAADVTHALFNAVLPQLPLTTLNSIVSVCRLSEDLFPDRRVSVTSVSLSMALMNGFACLFGAMPSCHGTGGLAAQYRFGARSGTSMVLLGGSKMLFAVALGTATLSLLAVFPGSVLGVLLCFSGLELALSAKHLKSEEDLTVAFITAGATLALKTGIGCAVGLAAAFLCGGYARMAALWQRGELRDAVLHGVLPSTSALGGISFTSLRSARRPVLREIPSSPNTVVVLTELSATPMCDAEEAAEETL